jgi:hypothetical protein
LYRVNQSSNDDKFILVRTLVSIISTSPFHIESKSSSSIKTVLFNEFISFILLKIQKIFFGLIDICSDISDIKSMNK